MHEQPEGQRPVRRKRSARHGAGRALPGLATGRDGLATDAPICQQYCPYPRISPGPSPGRTRFYLGKPSARPRPICQQYCPYPRISRGPLAGPDALLSRQTFRPAQANRSKVMPLSADKRPRPGTDARTIRRAAPARGRGGRCPACRRAGRVGHRRANRSEVLPLSADKLGCRDLTRG